MYSIRYAQESDKEFWFTVDKIIDEKTFERKIRDNMCYIFEHCRQKIGILRYQLFQDNIPFCNLLVIHPEYRHQGCGKALLRFWEQDMREQGYFTAMVCAKISEDIQHFYRKMGYREIGGTNHTG